MIVKLQWNNGTRFIADVTEVRTSYNDGLPLYDDDDLLALPLQTNLSNTLGSKRCIVVTTKGDNSFQILTNDEAYLISEHTGHTIDKL